MASFITRLQDGLKVEIIYNIATSGNVDINSVLDQGKDITDEVKEVDMWLLRNKAHCDSIPF